MTKKKITDFLQTELSNILKPRLLQVGYIPPILERRYPGHLEWLNVFFDVLSMERRRKGNFAIWEIEISGGGCEWNVVKCKEILTWTWKPTLFMFHIFSPLTSHRKTYSKQKARELKNEYGRKLRYYQMDLDFSVDRFQRMVDAFDRSQYSAKQYYGKELKAELRQIVKKSLEKLSHR